MAEEKKPAAKKQSQDLMIQGLMIQVEQPHQHLQVGEDN